MLIVKVKSEGLAHLSYLVGSDGLAAVIDPRRDCQVYLDIAYREGLKIVHILETHRNEDYVVGSLELAAMTGATIRHGDLGFGYGRLVRDGDELTLGTTLLRAISTPGHTPESMSYAVIDLASGPEVVGVFTGDALFVGEVGRTDLLGPECREELSGQLYDSLHSKLLPLGDRTIIFPAHGAGSVCGDRISSREDSTIGLERRQNHALMVGSREEFIAMKKAELLEKPYYFEKMEEYNLAGPPLLGRVPRPKPLSPAEFRSGLEQGGTVLDVRSPPSFAAAHVPGSLNIPLEILSGYAGWVLGYGPPIYLVVEESHNSPVTVRELIRIGYDDLAGVLSGCMTAWAQAGLPFSSFPAVTPRQAYERIEAGEDLLILDVRKEGEWRGCRVPGAQHIFVGHLPRRLAEVPGDRPVAVMCSSGFRGSLGASILQSAGYRDVCNILGGMHGWKMAGLPVEK
jgi:hydroxyacylglutathione hydrolase